MSQRPRLVQGDMIRLVACDFELRVFFGRVMDVSFSVDVLRVNPHDFATDSASLRVPTHVIAYLECATHIDFLDVMFAL
jgi:hypothetical protein